MPSIEESIRSAVQEAVYPLVEEVKRLKEQVDHKYPPAVKAKDAAKMMSLGLNKMYELAHNPQFYPAIWVDDDGNQTGRVIFSSEGILKWIREHSEKSA